MSRAHLPQAQDCGGSQPCTWGPGGLLEEVVWPPQAEAACLLSGAPRTLFLGGFLLPFNFDIFQKLPCTKATLLRL